MFLYKVAPESRIGTPINTAVQYDIAVLSDQMALEDIVGSIIFATGVLKPCADIAPVRVSACLLAELCEFFGGLTHPSDCRSRSRGLVAC
jgi:hypothetical protein